MRLILAAASPNFYCRSVLVAFAGRPLAAAHL